jgi:hypothetical protein
MHCLYHSSFAWNNLRKHFATVILFLLLNFTLQAQTSTTCAANAGDFATSQVCFQANQITLKAIPRGNAVVPQGYQVLYVLTKSNQLTIQQVATEPIFALPDSTTGLFTIHTLVYDSATLDLDLVEIGETTGFDVNALLIQGGGNICAALNVLGVKFSLGSCEAPCAATSGRLTPSSSSCLLDGKATVTAKVQIAPIVPPGFTRLYVLTSGDNLVIRAVSAMPSFVVNGTGRFTIHTLVYDSTTLDLDSIIIGQTTGGDVNGLLAQGGGDLCGALDVTGARFNVVACPPVCNARAGTLKAESSPCLSNGKATLKATVLQSPTVPSGYQIRYLLTSGYGYVIQQISTTPSFVVTGEGLYTIHTLVYNPNTFDLNSIQLGNVKAADLRERFIQGGGTICAALDLTGAAFTVKDCPCIAKVGVLKADSYQYPCLENGKATIIAKFTASPTVPQGYQVRFVLTSGTNLVIRAVSTSAFFTVNNAGLYTIHTLVYNPNTLDLNAIQIGVTTGFDVNKLLLQGGGNICGALDVYGVPFQVKSCVPTCGAKAGKLKPDNDPCLQDETATLIAKAIEAPTIPNGYLVRYVLTSGDNLVIRAINTEPTFEVSSFGRYTIHTLVYNPNTLDLSAIKIGVTTGYDVNELLEQGGGNICGALDVYGARFLIYYCDGQSCTAKAGKLHALADSPCILYGKAQLSASISQNPVIPHGFQVVYILASGDYLTIEQIKSEPKFEVTRAGRFSIHMLVYNPATLNLGSITFGHTNLYSLYNLLIENNGSICASLDTEGAVFISRNCSNGNLTASLPTGEAYPNPTSGVVNLNFLQLEKVNVITVEVTDLSGNLLKTWKFDGAVLNATLDLSEWSAGMYNVRVVYDNQTLQNIRVAKTTY